MTRCWLGAGRGLDDRRAPSQARRLGYSEAAFQELRDAEMAAERGAARGGAGAGARPGRAQRRHEAVAVVARRRAERAERERAAAETAGELALHQELDRALTDLRTELNATLRPDLSELASGFPARPHQRPLHRPRAGRGLCGHAAG